MKHSPGPWRASPYSSVVGIAIMSRSRVIAGVRGTTDVAEANARLIAAAPDLLALAKQYASECGECAGTRVVPGDDEGRFGDVPCDECADIWLVIDAAEGRT